MGLSSSQARLLSITARQHDIEYAVQKMEAKKLQLANQSDRVYDTYLNALSAAKLQYDYTTDKGETFTADATLSGLENGIVGQFGSCNQPMFLTSIDAKTLFVTPQVNAKYDLTGVQANHYANLNEYLKKVLGESTFNNVLIKKTSDNDSIFDSIKQNSLVDTLNTSTIQNSFEFYKTETKTRSGLSATTYNWSAITSALTSPTGIRIATAGDLDAYFNLLSKATGSDKENLLKANLVLTGSVISLNDSLLGKSFDELTAEYGTFSGKIIRESYDSEFKDATSSYVEVDHDAHELNRWFGIENNDGSSTGNLTTLGLQYTSKPSLTNLVNENSSTSTGTSTTVYLVPTQNGLASNIYNVINVYDPSALASKSQEDIKNWLNNHYPLLEGIGVTNDDYGRLAEMNKKLEDYMQAKTSGSSTSSYELFLNSLIMSINNNAKALLPAPTYKGQVSGVDKNAVTYTYVADTITTGEKYYSIPANADLANNLYLMFSYYSQQNSDPSDDLQYANNSIYDNIYNKLVAMGDSSTALQNKFLYNEVLNKYNTTGDDTELKNLYNYFLNGATAPFISPTNYNLDTSVPIKQNTSSDFDLTRHNFNVLSSVITTIDTSKPAVQKAIAMFQMGQEFNVKVLTEGMCNNAEYITNMIQNAAGILLAIDLAKVAATDFSYISQNTSYTEHDYESELQKLTEKARANLFHTDVDVSTSLYLSETSNNEAINKAQAKYESDMNKINRKEERIDTTLAALETERSSLTTERSALEKVAKDNIDMNFKLFS